jgi:flagellar motor component MotA
VIFILGVAVIILGFIYGGGLEGFKILINISGAIVSSLGAFQLKEIIHRKEKIGVFEMIKIHLHKIKEEGRSADQTDLKRIEELLWKLIEKTAGG